MNSIWKFKLHANQHENYTRNNERVLLLVEYVCMQNVAKRIIGQQQQQQERRKIDIDTPMEYTIKTRLDSRLD